MEIIERAAQKLGSFSKLAKELGISKQQMSDIRHGRYGATPYQVGKCAEICDEPWEQHAFRALMSQERTATGKEFWRGKLQTLTVTGATVLLASFLTLIPLRGATPNALPDSGNKCGILDIMLSHTFALLSMLLRAILNPRSASWPGHKPYLASFDLAT